MSLEKRLKELENKIQPSTGAGDQEARPLTLISILTSPPWNYSHRRELFVGGREIYHSLCIEGQISTCGFDADYFDALTKTNNVMVVLDPLNGDFYTEIIFQKTEAVERLVQNLLGRAAERSIPTWWWQDYPRKRNPVIEAILNKKRLLDTDPSGRYASPALYAWRVAKKAIGIKRMPIVIKEDASNENAYRFDSRAILPNYEYGDFYYDGCAVQDLERFLQNFERAHGKQFYIDERKDPTLPLPIPPDQLVRYPEVN